MLSVAVTNKDLYYAGTGYILDMPEFYDIDITRNLLMMLDEVSQWQKLFGKIGKDETLNVVLGTEISEEIFNPYSFIFSKLKVGNDQEVVIGVVGPRRVRYSSVVPRVSYCARLLEEIARW
jgi:heat-inducible transcriptional repressor